MHGAGLADSPRSMPVMLCGWNCRKAERLRRAGHHFKGKEPMNSAERHEARYRRRKAKRDEKRKALLEEYGDFDRVLSMNALSRAADQATKGVGYKGSVKKFMLRKLTNIADLRRRLETGKDIHKGFICFNVVERGKLRRIMSVHYSERVVQKSLNQNALIPVMSRPLIHDNSASRMGMGTGHALKRLVTHLRRYYRRYGNKGYVLQIDLKDYFGSIDHGLVKDRLRKSFDDERIIRLACRLVDSYYEHYRKEAAANGLDPDEAEAKGLGLGSEINQTLAVAHLDPLDHFIKERLRIKYYARYNDDLYLIHHDKDYLKYCYQQIQEVCARLKVTPNGRKTHITTLAHGFTFLKTQVFLTETGKIIRKPCRSSIARARRRLKRQARLVDMGLMDFSDVRCSFASWKGSVEKKQARRSIRNMERLFNRLFIDRWIHQQEVNQNDGHGASEH